LDDTKISGKPRPLLRRELILPRAADWTDPIFGKVFKRDPLGDPRIGITLRRVIDVTADIANISFHVLFPPSVVKTMIRDFLAYKLLFTVSATSIRAHGALP
jgi:hypothetical protein